MSQFKLFSDADYLDDKVNWMYFNHATAWEPSFDVIVYNQKGYDTYLGHLPARIIDALSFVPAIDVDKEHAEMADHLLGQPAGEWQRNMNKSRIEGLGEFWADEDKFIVNPVILGVQEGINYELENMALRSKITGNIGTYDNHQSITTAKISLDSWQHHTCPACGNSYSVSWQNLNAANHHFCHNAPTWLWSGDQIFGTRCPNPECVEGHTRDAIGRRPPLLLIDGQHRIRGLNSFATNSPATRGGQPEPYNWDSEQVAFTLLKINGANSYPAGSQARIFSDINTTAKDLDMRHKMYMAYRFQLEADVGGAIKNVNMGTIGGAPHPDRIAYQATLGLIGTGVPVADNPIHNRVSPLEDFETEVIAGDVVPDKRYYVRTLMNYAALFNFIKEYQRAGYPFEGETQHVIARLFKSYFEAVRMIWDRNPADPNETHFWVPTHQHAQNPPPLVPYSPQRGGPPAAQEDYLRAQLTIGGGMPNASQIRDAARHRLWNSYTGIISHSSKNDSSTITMRILRSMFGDVIYLAGWRPNGPTPNQAAIQAIFDKIKPIEWIGDGWTGQPTHANCIIDILRDYLYDKDATGCIDDRFTAGGVCDRPEVQDRLVPFLDSVNKASHQAEVKKGTRLKMPCGVTMEMQRWVDQGAPLPDINEFISSVPIAQDPVKTGNWGLPQPKDKLPVVTADSCIDFFMPINSHGNAVVHFTQTDAANNIVHTKTRHIKPANCKYQLVGNYGSQAIGHHDDGVFSLPLEAGADYLANSGDTVVVEFTVKNLVGPSDPNRSFEFRV